MGGTAASGRGSSRTAAAGTPIGDRHATAAGRFGLSRMPTSCLCGFL